MNADGAQFEEMPDLIVAAEARLRLCMSAKHVCPLQMLLIMMRQSLANSTAISKCPYDQMPLLQWLWYLTGNDV